MRQLMFFTIKDLEVTWSRPTKGCLQLTNVSSLFFSFHPWQTPLTLPGLKKAAALLITMSTF